MENNGINCVDSDQAILRFLIPSDDLSTCSMIAYTERRPWNATMRQSFLLADATSTSFRILSMETRKPTQTAFGQFSYVDYAHGSWTDSFVSAEVARDFYDDDDDRFADHVYRIAPRPDFEALIRKEKEREQHRQERERQPQQVQAAAD